MRVPLLGVVASLVAAILAGAAWSLTGAATDHALAVGAATFLAGSALPLLVADALPGLIAARRLRRKGIHLARSVFPAVARLDTVVLDKDGTVTTGTLRVVSVDPLDPRDDQNLRWFAGALTHAFDDRVGHAVARLASRGKLTDVEVVAGQGVRGSVDRHPVRVGAPQWVGVNAIAGVGHCVGVEVDGRPFGSITVGDSIRPHAHECIEELRALGVEPVLASTDTDVNTKHVGTEVGIERSLGFADPVMMLSEVREMRSGGRRVGYVGADSADGPAAVADLALGPLDSDAPVRMEDLDVARIPLVVRAARRALGRRRAALPIAVAGAMALGIVAALDLLPVPLAALATVALALITGAVAVS